jgi:hypothetical protein
MIDEFDKDEDGEICLEEFSAIMKQSTLLWFDCFLILFLYYLKLKQQMFVCCDGLDFFFYDNLNNIFFWKQWIFSMVNSHIRD